MSLLKKKSSKIIFLTGGGTAGHVTPNLALIPLLKENHWDIHYIGTQDGIEKELIQPCGISYHIIKTGKLRRYFSWQNFTDPFKLLCGIGQSIYLCWRYKPQIIFSKGGFVSLPVVIGAWLNRIPVILHESDFSPGLANRLSLPFAKKVLLTFSETARYFTNQKKLQIVGTPIRPALLQGKKAQGLAFTGLSGNKPIILIICGSLGSKLINQVIRESLTSLLSQFDIIHICGKGNVDNKLFHQSGYKQYEYLNKELADAFACSDLVISRAGANTLYELLTLHKPNILIPLSAKASRGDQILNARFFSKEGYSVLLPEEELNTNSLLEKIHTTMQNLPQLQVKLDTFPVRNSLDIIYQIIERTAK